MPLEQLSPELLSLILGQIGSSRDLFNVISASVACFRVFRQSRKLILSSLLLKTATPIILHHLVAVLRAPRYIDSCLDPPDHRQLVSTFLNAYLGGKENCFELPSEEGEILALCRLNARISSLANKYFEDVVCRLDVLGASADSWQLERMLRHPASKVAQYHPPLSNSELVRLKRAFLRFEIYCRIFPRDPRDVLDSLYSSHEQSQMFVTRLTAWEMEEILLVHQYYSFKVAQVYLEVEEDLAKALPATPGIRRFDDGWEPPREDARWGFRHLDLTDLSPYSRMMRHDLHLTMSGFTSLGLQMLYSMVHGNRERRSELLRHNVLFARDFLPEALDEASETVPAVGTSRPDSIHVDDPSFANFGYWSFQQREEGRYLSGGGHFGIRQYYPIRHLGYVFWDSERFQHGGYRESFEVAVKIEREYSNDRFNWRARPSLEERLPGYWLPREEFKNLERAYGSTFDHDEFPYRLHHIEDCTFSYATVETTS